MRHTHTATNNIRQI